MVAQEADADDVAPQPDLGTTLWALHHGKAGPGHDGLEGDDEAPDPLELGEQHPGRVSVALRLSRELGHVAKEPARRVGVVRDGIVRAAMGSTMVEVGQKGQDRERDRGGCVGGCHGGDSWWGAGKEAVDAVSLKGLLYSGCTSSCPVEGLAEAFYKRTLGFGREEVLCVCLWHFT